MNKFGILKSKILQKLTEAYASGNKSEIKEILMTVTKNKDFRDMYLFYEEIEDKYILNKEDAKLYVEEVSNLIKEKSKNISKFCKELDKQIGDVSITENKLYLNLDILLEDNNLRNVDKKIKAKIELIEHLMTKKESEKLVKTIFTENENLLHNVLANDFNVLYGNTLNEEQKEELKKILDITTEELETNFKSLQEEVTKKMTDLFEAEKNDELRAKINVVLTEANHMTPTKYNYYKLQQLKNGI